MQNIKNTQNDNTEAIDTQIVRWTSIDIFSHVFQKNCCKHPLNVHSCPELRFKFTNHAHWMYMWPVPWRILLSDMAKKERLFAFNCNYFRLNATGQISCGRDRVYQFWPNYRTIARLLLKSHGCDIELFQWHKQGRSSWHNYSPLLTWCSISSLLSTNRWRSIRWQNTQNPPWYQSLLMLSNLINKVPFCLRTLSYKIETLRERFIYTWLVTMLIYLFLHLSESNTAQPYK